MGQTHIETFRQPRRKLTLKTQLINKISCPFCNKEFPPRTTYSSMNDHLYKCGNSQKGESTKMDSMVIETENDFQLVIDYNNFDSGSKKPKSEIETPKVEIAAFSEKQKLRLLFLNFDTKYSYFRSQLLKNDTGEVVDIHSIKELMRCNLYHEIYFINDNVNIPLTTLFNIQIDDMVNRNSISITKNKRMNITQNTTPEDAKLLGIIFVKSVINNLPIKYKISQIFLKLIFELRVSLDDIKEFEANLYNSLRKLREIKNIEKKTHLCYIVEKKDQNGNIIKDELLFGGEKIKVTNNNVDDYIDKRIHYELKKYNETIFYIKTILFDNINKSLFSVFTLNEIEKIICSKV